ncbi:MAG TPA: rhamnogalacturonan acetylesterase [Opitutaceae bacterium]|nr:rhamnogalacturonan acetylesterase [Opitutaceae bacterium]
MNPTTAPFSLALGLCLACALPLPAQEKTATPPVPGNFDGPAAAAAKAAPGRPRLEVHSPRDDQPWSPTDFAAANPKLPTLVIAGDSTASTGDTAHRGWGAVLIDYFDPVRVNVVNRAIGGRSFRTFYGEGAWQKVVDGLKPGDFVVIEFGHNDGGPVADGPARGDLPGVGDETQVVTKPNGASETVHTYGWYTRTFIRDVKAKGATPIVSSTTVRNMWSNPNASFRDAVITKKKDGYRPADDRVERGMGHMLEWARQVAAEEHVAFLDHSNITADTYEKAGREETAKFFPADHTHTSTEGAIRNAETLIAGLKALPDQPLVAFLNEKGKAIPAYRP